MDSIRAAIRQFILCTFLHGESSDTLQDDTPLQTSGILDSLATLDLIAFLEKRYNIELDVYDTSLERFDTLTDMASTVARKLAATAQPVAAAVKPLA